MIWLPITGALLALVSLMIFGIPAALLLAAEDASQGQQIAGGAVLLVGLYLASFFVIYFNVALAAAANAAFKNEPVTFSGGTAIARSKVGVIAQWALVAGLVSLAFALLRDRGGLAGQIAAGVGAAIWSLITFLVIPVLAFEDIGPITAIKRSAGLFKQKWGEQITGNAAIGLITVLFILLGIALGVGGGVLIASGETAGQAAGVCLLLGGLIIVGIATVVSAVARGVFGVALYHYVADGAVAGPFSQAELDSAVRQKKGSRVAI